jgi:hypothetical protein
MVRDPGVGQEFNQPIDGMGRQPFQDILEVGERIDVMTLATSHQAIQGRRRPAAAITPNKQIMLTIRRSTTLSRWTSSVL